MLKASVFSLALLLAFTAAASAQSRHVDEWSSAKKTTHASSKHAHHRYARGTRAPGGEATGHQGGQQGENACGGDARRLCRAYLGQGDMAVLGCFRTQPTRLSRGCRALLQSYGQI
jgi:hypothetical protein